MPSASISTYHSNAGDGNGKIQSPDNILNLFTTKADDSIPTEKNPMLNSVKGRKNFESVTNSHARDYVIHDDSSFPSKPNIENVPISIPSTARNRPKSADSNNINNNRNFLTSATNNPLGKKSPAAIAAIDKVPRFSLLIEKEDFNELFHTSEAFFEKLLHNEKENLDSFFKSWEEITGSVKESLKVCNSFCYHSVFETKFHP